MISDLCSLPAGRLWSAVVGRARGGGVFLTNKTIISIHSHNKHTSACFPYRRTSPYIATASNMHHHHHPPTHPPPSPPTSARYMFLPWWLRLWLWLWLWWWLWWWWWSCWWWCWCWWSGCRCDGGGGHETALFLEAISEGCKEPVVWGQGEPTGNFE